MANFDKKVHKPQYWTLVIAGVKKQNMQKNNQITWYPSYASLDFLDSEELKGNHKNALNPFKSKLMTLNLRGGL